METIRIRKAGYAMRMPYKAFVEHYRILLPGVKSIGPMEYKVSWKERERKKTLARLTRGMCRQWRNNCCAIAVLQQAATLSAKLASFCVKALSTKSIKSFTIGNTIHLKILGNLLLLFSYILFFVFLLVDLKFFGTFLRFSKFFATFLLLLFFFLMILHFVPS